MSWKSMFFNSSDHLNLVRLFVLEERSDKLALQTSANVKNAQRNACVIALSVVNHPNAQYKCYLAAVRVDVWA